MEKLEIDCLIIGAGVVGLSFARTISTLAPDKTILIVERHPKFWFETSSHNSEVIHAGIYYKNLPLKALHCRQGNQLTYEFCEKFSVPFQNCGKLVIANTQEEIDILSSIQKTAKDNDVIVNFLSKKERANHGLEDNDIKAALWSPTSGIVDSHSLMQSLEALAHSQGANFLYRHHFVKVAEKNTKGSVIEMAGPSGEKTYLQARTFINCAGLGAARVAQEFELPFNVEIRACRGRYFSLKSKYTNQYKHLIYPVPDPKGGLGIHLTFDMSGKCRLGPDVEWVAPPTAIPDLMEYYRFEPNYEPLQQIFTDLGKKVIPSLKFDDLVPDYVGVRPKLFIEGEAHKDFKIIEGSTQDLHLLGIESPGLTSALSLSSHYSPWILDRLN